MNEATGVGATTAEAPIAVSWHLPEVLIEAIDKQAATEAVSSEVIAARVVEAGLSELGLLPNGRCSVRTGLCGSGPVPLPMQQRANLPINR